MLWLILLAVAVWLIWEPSWLPKLPDVRGAMDRLMLRSRAQTSELVTEVGGIANSVRGDNTLATKFREWVSTQSTTQEFQMFDKLPAQAQSVSAWLATLSDKELRQLTTRVAQHTASVGLNLEWLLDNRLDAYPAVKQAIEQTVVLYTINAWRADGVQQDVKAFRAYQAWVQDPPQYRALGQHLYSALVKQGLVTTSPDLYLAPEKQRNTEAIKEIKQVAASNPAAIAAIVREYVTPAESVKLQAQPQSAS